MNTKPKNQQEPPVFYKFYDAKENKLLDGLLEIKKHKLFNNSTEEESTVEPLLNHGYNQHNDTPVACVIAFNAETKEAIGMSMLTEREYRDDEGDMRQYNVGHIYVKDEYRGNGIGTMLIHNSYNISSLYGDIYWYYTPSSRGLYEKHDLKDVVLFESMEGILNSLGDESNFIDEISETSSRSQKSKKKHKHSSVNR